MDIMRNKRVFGVFFIQLAVVLLLVAHSLQLIVKMNTNIKRLDKLKAAKAYVSVDYTTDDKIADIMSNEKRAATVDKLKEFYLYMYGLDCVEQYTVWGYEMGLNPHGIPETQKTANSKFFEVFNFRTIEGRLFRAEDFMAQEEETVPVLIGYNLKACYKLGEIYDFRNGGTGRAFKGKVIGVLEYNSSYPDIADLYYEINLNNTYIIPLNIKYMEKYSGISDFDMAINSTVLFSDNPALVKEIEDKYRSYNVFNVKYVPIQESLNEFVEYMEPQITYEMIVAFIVIIFAEIGIVSAVLLIINRNIKEFGIHILCGAGLRDIIARVVLQLFFTGIAAIIPVVIIFCNVSVVLLTCAVLLIVEGVTAAIPVYNLKSKKVIEMVRRNE